jgi:Ring finger domain/PA domain
MTIPASNWCADCDEECRGHSRVCTQCGGTLTAPPGRTSTAVSNTPSLRLLPELDAFLPGGLSMHDVRDQLREVREQVRATQWLADQAIANNTNEWQTIPAALLDPSASSSGKTPTSQQVLQKLPLEKLHAKSASFFQVTLVVTTKSGTREYEGVTGELGALPLAATTTTTTTNHRIIIEVDAPLWIPHSRNQRTLKEPFTNLPTTATATTTDPSFIAVLERGHGISFFTKSLAAEKAGAVAVIVMNDKEEPWPYVMKDSRTPAEKKLQGTVSIPVVMISQAQGRDLLATNTLGSSAKLAISHNAQHKSCVICTDDFSIGQTILTLTNYCGHVFHKECAMQWLKQHNTCPYCRRALPTDNPDEERERLRQMTTGRGDGTAASFYS